MCNAPKKSKYPWVFKLIHTFDVKTLVFAVDTDFDLKASVMLPSQLSQHMKT